MVRLSVCRARPYSREPYSIEYVECALRIESNLIADPADEGGRTGTLSCTRTRRTRVFICLSRYAYAARQRLASLLCYDFSPVQLYIRLSNTRKNTRIVRFPGSRNDAVSAQTTVHR